MSAGDRQAGPPAADLYGAGASPCPAEAPLAWSVDDADGWLQGPLDLAYLGGRRLSLTLGQGQSALLVDDDRVLAAFGTGTHELKTAGDGPQRLLFFSAGPGPELRWPPESPLNRGEDRCALTGEAGLDVADAVSFFATFVAGGGAVDTAFVLVLIDRLVQDAIGSLWTGEHPLPQAADLDPALLPCGLACRRLALQAAARPEPAVPAVEAWRPVLS